VVLVAEAGVLILLVVTQLQVLAVEVMYFFNKVLPSAALRVSRELLRKETPEVVALAP